MSLAYIKTPVQLFSLDLTHFLCNIESFALTCLISLKNKYKEKYTSNMKGHYEDSGIDKRTMHAMKARKLASDVSLFFF